MNSKIRIEFLTKTKKMKNGGRVIINMNMEGEVGHSVIMQRIIEKTITKINGRELQKVLYRVMDPSSGGSFYRINSKTIIDALNIFYIFK